MRAILPPLIVAVAMVAGCGSNALNDDDALDFRGAYITLLKAQAIDATYPSERGAVDTLIRVYRDNDGATLDGQPLREVLEDAASSIDELAPDLAAKIDRALS